MINRVAVGIVLLNGYAQRKLKMSATGKWLEAEFSRMAEILSNLHSLKYFSYPG